jgi:hypothetical protein
MHIKKGKPRTAVQSIGPQTKSTLSSCRSETKTSAEKSPSFMGLLEVWRLCRYKRYTFIFRWVIISSRLNMQETIRMLMSIGGLVPLPSDALVTPVAFWVRKLTFQAYSLIWMQWKMVNEYSRASGLSGGRHGNECRWNGRLPTCPIQVHPNSIVTSLVGISIAVHPRWARERRNV